MKQTSKMASCGIIYIPSFINIDIGFHGILRFCLRKLRGCIVGISVARIF
jgi:hypothetical protein